MDWKSYYRAELLSPEGRRYIANLFARYPRGEPQLERILERGGIVSFPHTSIYYAGDSLARLVTTLYKLRPGKVVALGVLHGGALPEPYQALYRGLSTNEIHVPRAEELFAIFRGAFVKTAPLETPFGHLLACPTEGLLGDVVREAEELLSGEFSLDAFFSLLALHAAERRVEPIPVLPLFVSLTRDPRGSFEVASEIAQWLSGVVDARTALVATGDLVHYGNGYSSPKEMEGKPRDPANLESFFLRRVRHSLDLALRERDYAGFFAICAELKSDQRQIVPVIGEYLGAGASYEILRFELSDYSRILAVPPPCVVASALVGFSAG
jgi:predicted class III extradiol MEMO1 family dioxygenase